MIVGYARTSTTDQAAGLADQQQRLAEAGCDRVVAEEASAAEGRTRPRLEMLIELLARGDTLVVTRLDRLGRSVLDVLAIVRRLDASGAALRILDLGGETVDTSGPTGRLVLTMLAAVAELERGLMLDRQRAGIRAAQAAGKYRGRAPTVRRQAEAIRTALASGERPADIARRLGIARSSVYRMRA